MMQQPKPKSFAMYLRKATCFNGPAIYSPTTLMGGSTLSTESVIRTDGKEKMLPLGKYEITLLLWTVWSMLPSTDYDLTLTMAKPGVRRSSCRRELILRSSCQLCGRT